MKIAHIYIAGRVNQQFNLHSEGTHGVTVVSSERFADSPATEWYANKHVVSINEKPVTTTEVEV